MSPEQCKGFPLDRRSDLFSLGVVMYELSVGRRPFRGETDFEIMDQIVHHGAQRPSEIVPSYPEQLEDIVMKLLDRAPSLRYATAERLMEDLDDFISKHQMRASAKPLAKYMKTLFADKIAALEQAEQRGVPLAQHIAQSITSESAQSELLTPPSAYPGLPPRTSELFAVPDPSSQSSAVRPEPVYPSIKPRGRKWLAVLGGLIVGGGTIAVVQLASSRESHEPSPPAVTEPATSPPPAPAPAPPVSAPVPAAVPVTVPPVPTVDDKPTTPQSKSPSPNKPPRHTPPKRPPPPRPTDKHEEPTWDPNSPFLPQQ
jgi:serine/threonine protein kinase